MAHHGILPSRTHAIFSLLRGLGFGQAGVPPCDSLIDPRWRRSAQPETAMTLPSDPAPQTTDSRHVTPAGSESLKPDEGPAAALIQRCGEQPAEPWLFFRRGWRWRWLSYAQASDQIVRGSKSLSQAAETAPHRLATAFSMTAHPDSVAVACIALSHGVEVRPYGLDARPSALDEGVLWLYVAGDDDSGAGTASPDRWPLPAAAGQLDRRPLEPLALSDLHRPVPSTVSTADGRWSLTALHRRAEELASILGRRPKGTRRPIVFATPALSPVDLLVVSWASLLAGAAWILEGDIEAFPATASWARPTALIANGAQQDALHRGLVATPKRHRRLDTLMLLGPGDATETSPQLWHELGVKILPFPAASSQPEGVG